MPIPFARTVRYAAVTLAYDVAGLLVTGGPYRLIRHPNYVAVIVEGAALPLVHTAWLTALVFGVLNAGLLTVRIRAENNALAGAATACSATL